MMVSQCWHSVRTINDTINLSGCNRLPPADRGTTVEGIGGIQPFFGRLWSCLDASKGANGARGRSRTADTVIFSHVLYQLSYPGIAVAAAR